MLTWITDAINENVQRAYFGSLKFVIEKQGDLWHLEVVFREKYGNYENETAAKNIAEFYTKRGVRE